MCYNPLHIKVGDNTKYFLTDGKLMFADVPCGECEDCVNRYRSDIDLLSRYEYEDCLSKGGKAVFLTYTYKDSEVPYKTYVYDSVVKDIVFYSHKGVDTRHFPDNAIYCFDYTHVQKHLNSLRKYFERKGIVNGIRYLFVSEYGSDIRYTQRPHYHAILYLSNDLINLYNGLETNEDCNIFLNDVQRYWQYGNVSASSSGLVCKGEECASYVSKYVSKKINLLSNRCFQRLFHYIECLFDSCFEFTEDYLGDMFNEYSAYGTPYIAFKHYSTQESFACIKHKSVKFGYLLKEKLETLRYSDYEKFKDVLIKGIIDSKKSLKSGKAKYNKVPRNIIRSLFYNVRSDGTFYHNKLYFDICADLYYDSISGLWSDIADLTNNDYRYSMLMAVYMTLLKGRSFNPLLYENIKEKFYKLDSDNLMQFIRYISRVIHGDCMITDIQDVTYDNCTYSEYSRIHNLKLVNYEDIENRVRDYCYISSNTRRLVAKAREEQSRRRKEINDIINLKKY